MNTEPNRDTIKFKKKVAKASLTKSFLNKLTPPAESADGRPVQQWTYDSTTPRLAICSWSSGAKTWYWVGRGPDGRMLRYKLGEYPEMVPEQAQKKAHKASANVADGIDPRAARQQARKEMTLGELFKRYLEDHAKPHKKTWEDDEKQFRRYGGGLKGRTLSSITRSDVMALHSRIGTDHGKYAANRLLSLVSKMYSFAANVGWAGVNPAKGVKRYKEESRERYLHGDELPRFFAGLEEETQLFQDFFTLLLLVGARRSNVQAMRFDQLDLAAATWRIPDTKNGKPLTVHLTAEALEILRRRLAESDGNPWVFPGGRKNMNGHLASPKTAWQRIRERAGLEDVHMHDLRRTLGSWQAATGASLPIIGKTLGHKNTSTTAVYARLNIDPVRTAVDTAVLAMMAAANGHKEGGEGQ